MSLELKQGSKTTRVEIARNPYRTLGERARDLVESETALDISEATMCWVAIPRDIRLSFPLYYRQHHELQLFTTPILAPPSCRASARPEPPRAAESVNSGFSTREWSLGSNPKWKNMCCHAVTCRQLRVSEMVGSGVCRVLP